MMGASKTPEVIEREKRTRAALEAYVSAWTNNDRDALLDVFAADARWFDPVGTPAWEGRENIGKFWDRAHAGGVTLSPQVQRIVVCGDEGVLLFRMVVRTPGGGGMALDVCDQMTVDDDGRIVLAKAYWDDRCFVPLEEA